MSAKESLPRIQRDECTTMNDWPAYMSRETLARYLAVDEGEIQSMVDDGRLPAPLVVGGRTVRWKFEHIKKPEEDFTGFVYFIECADFIKIGFSNDAQTRIKNIAHGIPIPVVTLLIIKGSLELEAELHQRFAEIRHRHEWFQKHPTLLAFIEQLKVEQDA